jgi:hypothetical protein
MRFLLQQMTAVAELEAGMISARLLRLPSGAGMKLGGGPRGARLTGGRQGRLTGAGIAVTVRASPLPQQFGGAHRIIGCRELRALPDADGMFRLTATP